MTVVISQLFSETYIKYSDFEFRKKDDVGRGS